MSPLLERERELEALSAALAAAADGAGSTVMIEGPAGIGKSRLLAAAAATARAAGLRLLEGRGIELERDVPFGVAIELLGPAIHAVRESEREDPLAGQAALAGSLLDRSLPVPHDAQALVRGLYWATVNLTGESRVPASRRPLAILIDDGQWADRPSLTFLAQLAARIGELPVAMIIARRTGETAGTDGLLDRLRDQPASMVLEPQALSESAVGCIVRTELPGSEPAFIAACAHVSGGNPFLTRELARSLRADAVLPTAGSVSQVERLVPASVLNSLLVRMGRLGESAARIAAAVAVLGGGTRLRHAIALAEVDVREAERAADALAEAAILTGGEPLGFTHPLIATAVYADLPDFARARMHREAAGLLVADAAPAQEIAAHLLVSRPDGDPQVLEILREAGRTALAQGDPGAATRLLLRALAEPPQPDLRPLVLLELAAAEARHGDTAAEEHAVEALAMLGRGDVRAVALRAVAGMRLALGNHSGAAAAMQEALAEVDPDDPTAQAVLADYLTVNMFRAPLHPEAQERLAPLAEAAREGHLPEDAGLLAHLALSFALGREDPLRVRLLADGATAADPLVDPGTHGMLMGIVVQALSSVDELEAAERIADAAVEAARPLGSALVTSVATFHRAIPLFYAGRVADALADLEQARVGIDEGWTGGLAWVASLKARALLELGDAAGAREALAIPPVPPESMDRSMLLFAQAQLALAERDHAAALEHATEAGRHLDTGFGIDHPGLLPWRDAAALAAVALGEHAEGRRLSAAALERAQWSGVPRAIARALRTAAVLAGGRERIDLLAAAAEVLEGSRAALMRTHVLVELGAALRRDGRRSDARAPLRKALQMADVMGVVPLAEQARQELRATGARPRRAAFTGVDALTPAERRVAQLAARGLTSPQIAQELFVTTKTIQSHLASAYRKLDISSRLQLASALGEDAAHPSSPNAS